MKTNNPSEDLPLIQVEEIERPDNCIQCGDQIPSERQISKPGVDTCKDECCDY